MKSFSHARFRLMPMFHLKPVKLKHVHDGPSFHESLRAYQCDVKNILAPDLSTRVNRILTAPEAVAISVQGRMMLPCRVVVVVVTELGIDLASQTRPLRIITKAM